MLEIIVSSLANAAAGLVLMAIGMGFMYVNTKIGNMMANLHLLDIDDAIEEQGNIAVALRRAGLLLGVAIGMYGVISGPSTGFLNDVIAVALYGAIVSVMFLGARFFNDLIILGHVKNTDAIKDGNQAVGWVECGGFVATGIIAMSSMMGQGGGFTTAIGFFVIGQMLLLCITLLYELVTPWSVRDELAKGNAAAGLRIAGLMVAVAVAVHGAIAADFVSWSVNLTTLAIEGSLAICIMMGLSYFIDRVFLSGTNIEHEIVHDKNIAAIVVVSALQIAGALFISASVV